MAMLDIFDGLKKVVSFQRLTIDGKVFPLHYRFTAIVIVAFGILITSSQYFGEPIECTMAHKDLVSREVMNTYCWVQATYSSPSKFNKIVGVEVAHPGVGLKDSDVDVRYYKYYQWVWIVLFFQAILFYLPHYIWKCMENKTISNILLKLDEPLLGEEEKNTSQQLVIDYLRSTKNTHNGYAFKYYLCEVLNFINVVGQIYFIDRFLDGEFTTYGSRVIQFMESDQDDRSDPMIYVFPRVTKCMFHKFGGTGEIEKIAALCVLPLNIVNEKIYVFMWFWFIILAVISALLLIQRIALSVYFPYRVFLLYQNNRMIEQHYIQDIIKEASIGDWFILYLLGQNMEATNFREIVKNLVEGEQKKGMINNEVTDEVLKQKAKQISMENIFTKKKMDPE